MILIGSRAMAHYVREYQPKVKNRDWDIIASHKEAEEYTRQKLNPCLNSWKHDFGDAVIEFHNEEFLNNRKVQPLFHLDTTYVPHVGEIPVCHQIGLALIKRSHLHRSLHFTKHMIHYQTLVLYISPRLFGSEFYRDFLFERKVLTEQAFPSRVVFGNRTNQEFVQDAVVRHFDHEELHREITGGNVSYLQLKKDPSLAAYDHDLWNAASDNVKLACIFEEAYVIALERFLIPDRLKFGKLPFKIAYYKALEKVCTVLDDGPLREYAIDNWNIVKNFDENVFYDFFNSQLWKNYASTY